MRTFAELDFVAKHENLVLVATGVGKTGLACDAAESFLKRPPLSVHGSSWDLRLGEMYASLADRSGAATAEPAGAS